MCICASLVFVPHGVVYAMNNTMRNAYKTRARKDLAASHPKTWRTDWSPQGLGRYPDNNAHFSL